MTPDIKLNGASVAGMGWLRETISFPVPQSQTNTLYRSSGACIISASELFFDVFHAGNQNEI